MNLERRVFWTLLILALPWLLALWVGAFIAGKGWRS